MLQFPGVMWAGSFDEKLHVLLTAFASTDLKFQDEMRLVSLYRMSFGLLKAEALF
jgi:hypothetical protein